MPVIPPWISVQPTDFLQAANAGAQAGLQVAQMRKQATLEAARLAQAAAEAAAQREAAAARANQAMALQQWETDQRMRMEAQRLQERAKQNQANLDLTAQRLALGKTDEARKQTESLAKADYYNRKLDLENTKLNQDELRHVGDSLVLVSPGGKLKDVVYKGSKADQLTPEQKINADILKSKINNLERTANDLLTGKLEDDKGDALGKVYGRLANARKALGELTIPVSQSKTLTVEKAREFYERAGRDRAKAEQMAKDEGYEF